MLNKDNYVLWSSRLIRYAKSKLNGKIIYISIMNGTYVRRMIPEPGDPDREVPVAKTFHEQTDDKLTEKENIGNQNGLIVVPGIANPNVNQIRNGNVVAARAEVTARDLDEIEKVNANCILMANLQKASTSGTQIDKASIYDSDGSAELLEPIPEPHQAQQNNSNVIFAVSSMEQSRGTVEQHPATIEETPAYFESLYNNLAIEVEKVNMVNSKMKEIHADLTTIKIKKSVLKSIKKNMTNLKEKSTVSSLQEEKKKLKSDFKIREDGLIDKQIQLENKIKELDNILVKMGQSIQTMHMLSPKPDSFYHTEQKMALEKHDPPDVYDSEETLQLAQDSRLKIKQLNKEIKPANYAKINQPLGVFVSQKAKSRKELYFSNTLKMASVSKSISIPNEEFSDDTSQSVARKFLNEVKSTIVTLQHVVKQKKTLDIHNWSSTAHQEIHKIVKDEILPIVNQVDARVQNFKIQFLKEAAKFVRDFKSLAKEADESLAMHKDLEFKIERLLRAVVSRDIMSIVQNTLDSLSRKLENENVELEFQAIPKVVETNDLSKPVTSNSVPTTTESKVMTNDKVIVFRINSFKTSRDDKFVPINKGRESVTTNPITVSQPHVITKKDINSNTNSFSPKDVESTTRTRRPQPRNNPKNDKVLSKSKSSFLSNNLEKIEENHRNL
ncbi:hypothetical protein Tco_0092966 [Tanacetum coccineum]